MRRLIAVVLFLAACSSTSDEVDGGLLDAGAGRLCAVDRQDSPEQALQLTVGTPFVGQAQLCPITDRDWYRFEVPADQTLVNLEVGYPSGATTPVELAYEIFAGSSTQAVAAVQDMIQGDNRSSLSSSHYFSPGTYFLRVRDVGDNEQDVLNNYGVTVRTMADMDPNEPNENCATATALNMMGGGTLAFAGDRDAYTFDVPNGARIIDVTVTTAGMTPVDFHVSLIDADGTSFLYDVTDERGEDGPTNLRLRYGVQSSGGRYCLTVDDDDATEADPAAGYMISVRIENEPDAQEQASRNDTPNTATQIGNGGQRTGIIASQNDLDWYRVTTAAIGAVIEVTVDCPSCTIQPAISLVYQHPDSACGDTSSCDYLLMQRSCTGDADCESRVCREIPSGSKRCAAVCGGPLDCPSFQCNQAGTVNACVGAAVCASGQCGVLQFTAPSGISGRPDPNVTPTRVRTAQPVQSAVTWVLVHDFQDDEFTSSNYTVNITVTPDPDPNEANNFYYSYPLVENPFLDAEDVLRAGRMAATDTPWSATSPRSASGSGCISYQGDVDVFRLAGGNPCAVTSTTGGGMPGGNCGLQLTYSRPGGDLDLAWFLYSSGFGLRASFLSSSEGGDTVFGDEVCGQGENECMIHRNMEDEDYYLVVRDFDSDAWDTSAARCYTWTMRAAASSGCPASCPMTTGNGLCQCP